MPNKSTARKTSIVNSGATGTTSLGSSDKKASNSAAVGFDDIGINQPVDTTFSEAVTVTPIEDEESETVGGGGVRKSNRIKKRASGGAIKSASSRADGCAMRGKTRGRVV